MTINSTLYHQRTSYQRNRIPGHFLDWENRPSVYKTYSQRESIPLRTDIPFPKERLSSLLSDQTPKKRLPLLGMDDLSRLFLLAYSFTGRAQYGGEVFYYRSVASAGALYPNELYMAAHGVDGLDRGLYHYSIGQNALFPIRREDLLAPIVEATLPTTEHTPLATFFVSAIFFRSAWKYRERAYRYHLLDTGHLIENLTLALKALRLPWTLSYDFDDHRANQILGLDEAKEVCMAVCHLLGAEPLAQPKEKEVAALPEPFRRESRVSAKEIDYPLIREMHQAGNGLERSSRQEPDARSELGVAPNAWLGIKPLGSWPEIVSYADAVLRRRSKRNFVKKPLPADALSALLESFCTLDSDSGQKVQADFKSICIGFLAGCVEGIEPGFYLLDSSSRRFGMVRAGSYTEEMARVCLDQAWLGHAAVHFLFMTNLQTLDRCWGARGYRYAMMTAGRMGERLYLSATAMGFGCCGIGALYDEEAAQLLGLQGASRLLYLVAVGAVKAL